MLAYPTLLLQWARTLGHRFFLQFGLHCATHQIRVILISAVVITSLFYPALSIYSSSQPKSLSLIDAFITPNSASSIAVYDLVHLWSGHEDTIRVYEDAVSRGKCSMSRALRVERILIQSQQFDEDGALNNKILTSTLDLERRLEDIISRSETPCLKQSNGRCFVLSPLAFWNYDKETLRSDTNILDKLSYTKNISVAGVPITPTMVLAGRGLYDHHVSTSKFDFAEFLALTYFFPESDCLTNSEHEAWGEMVKTAARTADVTTHSQEPTLVTLEYDPNLSKTNGFSALSAFIYLAYIGFFAYVGWSMRRLNGVVHSLLGVTFTALTEIAVSTITSLSVCALVGFKVTMVPWELLPIVIAFVGAENMFNLVDAVGKTSVTLSVKQRIAEGLSRSGTSNTLKVVSYNAILGIISVFSVGAVRQFCIFAVVVLVAHWFLAHTFFMAVLSIDIARLELEELLRHDTSLAPVIPKEAAHLASAKQPRSGWRKLVATAQNLLKGRAATNVSLLMLLAVAAALYYSTYTASVPDPRHVTPLGAVARNKTRLAEGVLSQSPAWHIWKTLNPSQTSLLHIRVDSPTVVIFRPDKDSIKSVGDAKGLRPYIRTFRLVLWLIKIMVIPIAATTSALWGFLLYLLKDTELLEAQRNRAESTSGNQKDDGSSLEGQVEFSTLPRVLPSDAELLAASKDGGVVVSIGLHNEISVWRAGMQGQLSIDATELLLGAASTSCASSTLTCVTVDKKGEYFAVGTGAGVIAVWALEGPSVNPLPLLSLDNSSAAVTEVHFVSALPSLFTRSPPCSESPSPTSSPGCGITLLSTYESGVAARWVVEEFPTVTYFMPSRRVSVVRASLLHVAPEGRVLFTFSLDDGILELVETGDYDPTVLPDCCIQAGSPVDMVWKAHACRTELKGSARFVVAVATESGVVSLWDGVTGECISVLEESYGKINHLRISPILCETCRFCGQLPLESISFAFSVDHIIQVYKLFINDQTHTRRCSCYQNQLRHISSRESVGRRSRSNSNASLPSSPLIPRARLATAFETSSFPVSGHGVHSRRASEKETGRRSSEMLTVPFTGDEYELSTYDGSVTPTNVSFWRNAVVSCVAEVNCERGEWDMTSRRFVGIRRKPRPQGGKAKGGVITPISLSPPDGLTTATLERWELWTFDPAAALQRSSLLASLSLKPPQPSSSSSSGNCIARLPFTRVSPLLTSSSCAFAGFGNTVGVFDFSDS